VAKPSLGRVRVCADEIRISLLHLSSVVAIHDTCSHFAKISGLKLSAPKCVLTLSSIAASSFNISLVRDCIAVHAPWWASMRIPNRGLYFGFGLGPSAGSMQWKAALIKFKLRVDHIYEANESSHLAVSEYNSKANTVLGYIGQLALPPSGLKRLEAASLNRVLHLATNSLPLNSFFSFKAHLQPQNQLPRCVTPGEHGQNRPLYHRWS